jgi:excisionase family DNA binding protein
MLEQNMAGNLSTVTIREACAILRVSRPKMYDLIRSGQLRASFVARKWIIRESEIEKYLDKMLVSSAPS